MSRKEKKAREQKLSTRQLINTKAVSDYSLKTYDGDELGVFHDPSHQPVGTVRFQCGARVYALMNLLKCVAEIEMLCLNSRENFEENKNFLRKRAEEERNPVIRRLLERDQNFLDRIQVQMATAREFLIIIRLHNEKGTEVFSYLDRIEKSLKEQGFSASRAGSGGYQADHGCVL